MEKLRIITKKQAKILEDLFNYIGISVEDLIEFKNSKEKIKELEKYKEQAEKRLKILEEAYTSISDIVQTMLTEKRNNEIAEQLNWGDN